MPRGQGLQQQSHPKAEEHPQAYQPATQLRAPLPPPPYYSTRHTEARNSVKVEWQKKNETERRGRGEDPKPKKAEGGGGNQEKRYATRTERHANKASSATQTQHRHLPWPPQAQKRHTVGQESASTLTNNGKYYKR